MSCVGRCPLGRAIINFELQCLSHLTSGGSVRPENTVTYSAGKRRSKICGVFSKTTSLWRFSTASVEGICMVGHFPAENAHAYYNIVTRRVLHSLKSISIQFTWHICSSIKYNVTRAPVSCVSDLQANLQEIEDV